ncbi:potassium-transporting ATPase subunit KdpA [Listeria booriae]|uniref:Potassium-transporting ATPase potassium-binding subunit n=1 Tax=Listeria booriae TaxID=1552123 RepID=A0A7X1CWI7_9LIST|nr:potassium-transporting ATPase subunit KdpA [Listeria booriae]MBC1291868.1 potassium-transporting ATPase subunit KdpA [Listeria booriae]MBC2057400.1 potassium-transporting ATPase subunit KdpA [Listeria booriae]MBC2171641.1 potassium-transporting ATPase subunit KdpA [Listeria booriae]MBC2372641.1 potassium-transporting ATPase subunit KdpA [Listeria booriae]MDT0109415.1 potassium-transporting ATPase subunit KdpA [Listeria booriae]
MEILQIIVVILILCCLIKPLGTYMYAIYAGAPMKGNRFFEKIEHGIYRLAGLKDRPAMSWKRYAASMLLLNGILMVFGFLVVFMQGLWANPHGLRGLDPTLAFNTVISFMTNTNLQHYSGETALTNMTQMIFITMMMFTSAATGLSVAIAFIRGITSKGTTLGNFYEDFTRSITRLLLPFAFILTLVLVALAVPQTLASSHTVTTLEGVKQTIALGPVASLEAIKHLGTNGGGFFGANSAHPFENPTPLTNVIEMLAMWAIPASLTYTYGRFAKNQKQGWVIFSAMFVLFLVFLGLIFMSEKAGNPVLTQLGVSNAQGSMEGKEMRFGLGGSTLFSTITTAATTGSVNNMHDTLTPLGGMGTLALMMLNVVFGGDGVGLINMLMYAMLGVFLCGLLIGRTPEFLGRKIEPREMKLITLTLLVHPIIILIPTATALLTTVGTEAISNPGFHGMTQVLYEFTSSAANNGSGFEGLGDDTSFWNLMTGVVMFLGRYISMALLLAVAGSMTKKQFIPETIGTFRTDNGLFTGILVMVVLVIGALTFLPVLALGPIAESLTL